MCEVHYLIANEVFQGIMRALKLRKNDSKIRTYMQLVNTILTSRTIISILEVNISYGLMENKNCTTKLI